MSPTVLRVQGLQFYFYASEEPRRHVHAKGAAGQAKIWLEPTVELAQNRGLSRRELRRALVIVQENAHVIHAAWEAFHGGR